MVDKFKQVREEGLNHALHVALVDNSQLRGLIDPKIAKNYGTSITSFPDRTICIVGLSV